MHHNLYWLLFWSILLNKKFNVVFHNHSNKAIKWKFLFRLTKLKISQIVVNKEFYNSYNTQNKLFSYIDYLENFILLNRSNFKYEKKSNQLSIIIISNLRRLKNIEFSIEVAEKLSVKKDVVLDIYYSTADPNYYNDLKKIIKFKDNSLHVNFIQGNKQPSQFFFKYDIALHTSYRESGPLSSLEYIAGGIPFVAFNTGQTIELIRNQFPEFIINKFDVKMWVDNIDKILSLGRTYYSKPLEIIYNKNYSKEKYFRKCKKIYLKNLN